MNNASDYFPSTKLLIVEDDQAYGKLMTRLLSRHFPTYKLVDNGEAAIDEIGQLPEKSLVLSDYELPGISGLEVEMLTREIRETKMIKFILQSGIILANQALPVEFREPIEQGHLEAAYPKDYPIPALPKLLDLANANLKK